MSHQTKARKKKRSIKRKFHEFVATIDTPMTAPSASHVNDERRVKTRIDCSSSSSSSPSRHVESTKLIVEKCPDTNNVKADSAHVKCRKYNAPTIGGGTYKLCCDGVNKCPQCVTQSVDDKKRMNEIAFAMQLSTKMPLELCTMADSYTDSIGVLWFIPMSKRLAIVPLAVYMSRALAEASLRKHAGLEPNASLEPFIPIQCENLKPDLECGYVPSGYEWHRRGRRVLSMDGEMSAKGTDPCVDCGRQIQHHFPDEEAWDDRVGSPYVGLRPHVFYQFPQLTESKVHKVFSAAVEHDRFDQDPAQLVLVMHDSSGAHGCPLAETWSRF